MPTGNTLTCMRSRMGGAAGLCKLAAARPGSGSAAAVAAAAIERGCLGLGLMCSSLPSPSHTRFAGSAAVAFRYTAAPLTHTGKGCLVCTSPTCMHVCHMERERQALAGQQHGLSSTPADLADWPRQASFHSTGGWEVSSCMDSAACLLQHVELQKGGVQLHQLPVTLAGWLHHDGARSWQLTQGSDLCAGRHRHCNTCHAEFTHQARSMCNVEHMNASHECIMHLAGSECLCTGWQHDHKP